MSNLITCPEVAQPRRHARWDGATAVDPEIGASAAFRDVGTVA